MQVVRCVVLGLALAAGGLTALLVGSYRHHETTVPALNIESAGVQVARTHLPIGRATAIP
jgi:hypothetical protein